MSFNDHANKLVPFETFDRDVFIGDPDVPQDVCNFVLSLALAYNDFRDVFFSRRLLDELEIDINSPPTVLLALRNGIENTIVRIQSGFIHELLKLLNDHQAIIKNKLIQDVIRQMSKPGKQSWQAILDVATSKSSDHPLARTLVLIRNKIAFHYDPKQIGRGYRSAFTDGNNYGDPLISRGSALSQTRFYFADASSQEYMLLNSPTEHELEFIRGEGEFINSINQAIYEIVTHFIQKRSGWSKPKIIGNIKR
jgi:hypothetical protein